MHVLRILYFISVSSLCFSQGNFPHKQAHAHNDYEHAQPLWSAIENGFISVEADVHLTDGKLLVSHDRPPRDARTLQDLYLAPLDSLLTNNDNKIYPNHDGSFYLMIDCKTEAESTYRAIQKEVGRYSNLRCTASHCPVKIFISGNRALRTMINEGYQGIALDGRPNDLGKGISAELMPVISDHFANWSSWTGKSNPQMNELSRIHELAQRVHAEGRKLRLWAIPDNDLAWSALLEAGVDFINTDRLKEFHQFMVAKGQ
jgi:Glycerophosphoryl diester phosphodiesterase family